jgi:hypothetical protein
LPGGWVPPRRAALRSQSDSMSCTCYAHTAPATAAGRRREAPPQLGIGPEHLGFFALRCPWLTNTRLLSKWRFLIVSTIQVKSTESQRREASGVDQSKGRRCDSTTTSSRPTVETPRAENACSHDAAGCQRCPQVGSTRAVARVSGAGFDSRGKGSGLFQVLVPCACVGLALLTAPLAFHLGAVHPAPRSQLRRTLGARLFITEEAPSQSRHRASHNAPEPGGLELLLMPNRSLLTSML